jgi:acetyltransferase
MDDGSMVIIRPIRPEDEPLMVAFHGTLSERSVYMRYLEIMKQDVRTAHDRLARICFIDYDRQMALVADRVNPWTGLHEIIGVGRLSKLAGANEAEAALLVSDSFHGHGLGSALMRHLLDFARDEGLGALRMILFSDNRPMRHVAQRFGFELGPDKADGTLDAYLTLSSRTAVAASESNTRGMHNLAQKR